MLAPEVQAQILTLYYTDKRSMESISRELGINRKTVIRVVQRREVLLVPKHRARHSGLDPYKESIRALLRKDPKITGSALLNHLRGLGYTGGITIVRDFVLQERGRMLHPREAYLRLEFGPGEVAQVDWGEFGDVFGDGIKIHCFAMVMAYSRMIYVEFTRAEKFEDFIRAHENAFRFFGGAPRECWYDNLASAVSDRMGGLIRFNPRFMAYMGHHGIRPHACNPARGNEKGRVENLIKYIRMNFWPGREFADFEDMNRQLIVWRNQTANAREHRGTRRVIRLLFESDEKPKLLPLNPTTYDTDEIFSRHVSSDFHLQYESNRYSVPWTLVGMTVTVRVNGRDLKVYYHEKFICSHVRSYLKNQVFTHEGHRVGLLERKPGATRETWQLGFVKNLGPKMAEYVELVRQGPRSLKYELSRLVALVTIYGEPMVLDACGECLKSGIVGVDNVELYLKRRHHPSRVELAPKLMTFDSEKLNRVHRPVDLRKYDALLFEVDQTQTSASEVEEKEHGNDPNQSSARGACSIETQALGPGAHSGSLRDGRSGARADHAVHDPMDRQGEGGEIHANDPEPRAWCQVPPASDGGEF